MRKVIRKMNIGGAVELSEYLILQDIKPTGPDCNRFVINNFSPERARKKWEKWGAEIMEKWPNKNTKPHNWYLFESPILPKFANSEWPNYWARYPEEIPSEAKQKKFLDSLK